MNRRLFLMGTLILAGLTLAGCSLFEQDQTSIGVESEGLLVRATPVSVSFAQGDSGPPIRVEVSSIGGFAGKVTLTLTGLPESLAAVLEDSLLTVPAGGKAVTTLRVGDPDMITPPGRYTATLLVTGGLLTYALDIEIEVQAMPHGM